jgi:flagellar L-ring protein precursor FlgH
MLAAPMAHAQQRTGGSMIEPDGYRGLAADRRAHRVGDTLTVVLTVRVTDVESDDMLRVRGEQTVIVNGEKQHFSLTGLVRSEDISATNVILSSRISEADIEFTGQGDVSEAQRRSVLYRIARWLRLI